MGGKLSGILNGFFAGVFALVLSVAPAAAGDIILSNNSGSESAVFFVEGEPTLVINGFDLTPLGVALPSILDAVSISVDAPVVGSAIDLLIYKDANGGSPIDATLVYQEQVTLDQSGLARVALAAPVLIDAPVLWVGFYLPVGFRFNADVSGSSVLTYWAWTAGGTFDVTSLANAAVLGPGDGTDPVAIAMNGVARINAELRAPELEETVASIPLGQQLSVNVAQDTSIMRDYSNCAGLLFDPEDIEISASGDFSLDCAVQSEINTPYQLQQPQGQTLDMQRGGLLYKVSADIPLQLSTAGAVSTLPLPVTHCIRISTDDLETAVLAEARGIPESWHVLPSVRFGDMICAEVTVANYISYFTPRTDESPPNVNLVLGQVLVYPHPLTCGLRASVQIPVANTGLSSFDVPVTIRVQDIHIASNTVTAQRELRVDASQFEPGDREVIELGPIFVDTYVNELHRIQVQVDANAELSELNELDNSWFTEYILTYPPGREECGQLALGWYFRDCKFEFREDPDPSDRTLRSVFESLEDDVSDVISGADGFSLPDQTDDEEGLEKARRNAAAEQIDGEVEARTWEMVEAFFARPRGEILDAIVTAIVRHHPGQNCS